MSARTDYIIPNYSPAPEAAAVVVDVGRLPQIMTNLAVKIDHYKYYILFHFYDKITLLSFPPNDSGGW